MSRSIRSCTFMLSITLSLVIGLAPRVHAGIGDAIKKTTDKAAKKAQEEANKASGQTPSAPAATEGKSSTGEASEAPATKVSAVSTKFDFVPGDRVLFYDDMTQDELGEFPKRFTLKQGTFEVAEMAGERWMRCTSNDGTVSMKVRTGLPEFWTLEFDFFGNEPMGSGVTVSGMTANGGVAWDSTFPHGNSIVTRSGDVFAETPLDPAYTLTGRHHLAFLARGGALKVYVDQQRVANVPEISTASGPVTHIEFRLWAPSQPMITNVRFAEGPRPPKDLLAEGKLVTYGISFATASDVVLPESAPVIRQVASYLESNPDVKLQISGHTDNVGGTAYNADLSKRRAASVARVLREEFSIAAERLTTDGFGDTQPVAPNTSPEGRAKNRRVEFAKL